MQDIYIVDEGKGFPLVLVHGFQGSSIMWKPQIDFLKEKFRVIVPDLPGFGKSKKIQSCDSIHLMSNKILDCLKINKIEKFHLLGHSMGGMIVQEMAKIDGDKIAKLICYSTGPLGELPGRFETIDESREKLKVNGLSLTTKNIAKTWFVSGEKARYFNICIQSGKETSLEAADNALIAMKKFNGTSYLKNIKNETLIIWGDKDRSYNFRQVDILNENIPKSEMKIFKGCAHNVHLEKPEEFNRTVINYLNKQQNN